MALTHVKPLTHPLGPKWSGPPHCSFSTCLPTPTVSSTSVSIGSGSDGVVVGLGVEVDVIIVDEVEGIEMVDEVAVVLGVEDVLMLVDELEDVKMVDEVDVVFNAVLEERVDCVAEVERDVDVLALLEVVAGVLLEVDNDVVLEEVEADVELDVVGAV